MNDQRQLAKKQAMNVFMAGFLLSVVASIMNGYAMTKHFERINPGEQNSLGNTMTGAVIGLVTLSIGVLVSSVISAKFEDHLYRRITASTLNMGLLNSQASDDITDAEATQLQQAEQDLTPNGPVYFPPRF